MCKRCDVINANTGIPDKAVVFGPVNREFLWPLVASDGTLNRLDLSSPIEAQIIAAINESDPTKRLFPLPQCENHSGVREATRFEDFPSLRKSRIGKGVKNVESEIINTDSYYLKNLVNLECIRRMGVIQIDECGNLKGDASVDGFLAGMPIEANTLDFMLIDATQDAVGKNKVMYQVAGRYKDENSGAILAEDIPAIDLLSVSGLLGVDGRDLSASAASQEVVASIFYDYSSEVTGEPTTNLLAADFELENITQASTTAPDTAVENPDGTYTLTFPLATFIATDELSLKVIKSGIEDSKLSANTITAGA